MELICDSAKELPAFILGPGAIQTHFIYCIADAFGVHLADLQSETNNKFPRLCYCEQA